MPMTLTSQNRMYSNEVVRMMECPYETDVSMCVYSQVTQMMGLPLQNKIKVPLYFYINNERQRQYGRRGPCTTKTTNTIYSIQLN